MRLATQPGITPPAPGQDKEEPEFRNEADIPTDDHGDATEDDARPSRERDRDS